MHGQYSIQADAGVTVLRSCVILREGQHNGQWVWKGITAWKKVWEQSYHLHSVSALDHQPLRDILSSSAPPCCTSHLNFIHFCISSIEKPSLFQFSNGHLAGCSEAKPCLSRRWAQSLCQHVSWQHQALPVKARFGASGITGAPLHKSCLYFTFMWQ